MCVSRAVNFAGAMEHAADLLISDTTSARPTVSTIEMGAHPTLTALSTDLLVAKGVRVLQAANSMKRGQAVGHWRAELGLMEAAMEAAAPGAAPPTSTALAAGKTVSELEVSIPCRFLVLPCEVLRIFQ